MASRAVASSLGQVIAITMTYRSLLVVWGVLPLVTVASPLVLNMAYFLLNRATSGHAILSIILTTSTTALIRRWILRSAPTEKDGQDAAAKTKWLPFVMFLVNTALLRGFGAMFGKTFLTWSPRIPLSVALRLSFGMLILGLAVMARYIGPNSVGA
jgi:hypothetical protein